MRRILVFNGWAAGSEIWDLTTFHRDWTFSYIEQLEGLPERVVAESDEVVLVGFSMGGTTAMRMILKFPEKIRGAVFVSTTPRMMEDKAQGWAGLSERRLAALKLGTGMVYRDDPSPIYNEPWLSRGLEYLQATDLRSALTAMRDEGRMPDFPVAIVHSERDGVVRPHNAAFLKSVFPQASVTMVPGNEHVLPVKVPDLIDKHVKIIEHSYEN